MPRRYSTVFNDNLMRDHQIEELLLRAHIERESGLDLIEEYFMGQNSLDIITRKAREMMQEQSDPVILHAIYKNLSECIVVKTQQTRLSFPPFLRRIFKKLGFDLSKSREVVRAERLIQEISKKISD